MVAKQVAPLFLVPVLIFAACGREDAPRAEGPKSETKKEETPAELGTRFRPYGEEIRNRVLDGLMKNKPGRDTATSKLENVIVRPKQYSIDPFEVLATYRIGDTKNDSSSTITLAFVPDKGKWRMENSPNSDMWGWTFDRRQSFERDSGIK